MKKILVFIALSLVVQFAMAKGKEDNSFELCSECGFYHYTDVDCDDAKDSEELSFNTNGAKKIKYNMNFEVLDVQNGVHLTIIEGEEEFIMINGSEQNLKSFRPRSTKTAVILSARNSYRNGIKENDSTLLHVLVCRDPKKPIKVIKAKNGSVVRFAGEVKADVLTIEASTASDIIINADVKDLRCIAKSASVINVEAACDTLTAMSESAAKIEIQGDVKALACNASFASEINFDVNADRIHTFAFYASKITGLGECKRLFAEASDASVCDLIELIVNRSYANVSTMSNIHLASTRKLNTIADKMGLIYVYDVDKNGEPVYVTDENGESVRSVKITATGLNISK